MSLYLFFSSTVGLEKRSFPDCVVALVCCE
jgi:hypothetical protein